MAAESLYHGLHFKNPSGTSRGVLRTKPSWFIKYTYGDKSSESDRLSGYGECSLIRGLSPDNIETLPAKLEILKSAFEENKLLDEGFFKGFPALRFAHEMATLDFANGGDHKLFESDFLAQKGIPINGLVWMGEKSFMKKQIIDKIKSGYRCIKIKIAAIDFEEELSLLKFIRSEFSQNDIEIRVDANGGFKPYQALINLEKLAVFNLHSIEQPIMPGQYDEMAALCESTPLDIALDEELIGVDELDKKKQLLDHIKPQYIILKPSLLGGFTASKEWIGIANTQKIGWWVTSALESNIGLNAIAQWTATLDSKMYQGLGTGQLFSNNIQSPLEIRNGHLFHTSSPWNFENLKFKNS